MAWPHLAKALLQHYQACLGLDFRSIPQNIFEAERLELVALERVTQNSRLWKASMLTMNHDRNAHLYLQAFLMDGTKICTDIESIFISSLLRAFWAIPPFVAGEKGVYTVWDNWQYMCIPVLILNDKTWDRLLMNQQMMTWQHGKVFHRSYWPMEERHQPSSWSQHSTICQEIQNKNLLIGNMIKVLLSCPIQNHAPYKVDFQCLEDHLQYC